MKILKPGKVEQRKFVCPRCGCVFVASNADFEQDSWGLWVICPQKGCEYNFSVRDDNNESYEESASTQTDRVRLAQLLGETRTIHIQSEVADYLIAHGVTFREE